MNKDYFKKIILIKKLKNFNYISKLVYQSYFKISKLFLLLKVSIYNGHLFNKKFLNKFRIGFRLGEFIWTRKVAIYKNKQKKKKK